MKVYLSLLLLIVIAGIWVWDWIAIVKGTHDDTVSAVIHQWSVAWPILPFLAGIVIGHLFWPHRHPGTP